MATMSYAEAATPDTGARITAKPVFIKERDFFTAKPQKEDWITHVELYKTIASHVPAEKIAGLQRVRGLWRIYMDDWDSRNDLLTSDFSLRGKQLPIYNTNPGFIRSGGVETIRIRVKNIPLSADDGQIKRALELHKCEIFSLFREKLRIDGRLTNCETGDRIVLVGPLSDPLPTSLDIGRYRATIYHRGQKDQLKCNRCLQTGHSGKECENEIVCKYCLTPGHIMSECPGIVQHETDPEQAESEHAESELDGEDGDESEGSIASGDMEVPDKTGQSVHDSTESDAMIPAKSAPVSVSATTKVSDLPAPVTNQASTKANASNKSPIKGTKQKKQNKNKNAPSTLDKYLSTTPSRKSSNLAPETRSPPTPSEEKGERPNKKQRDDS